VHQLIRLLLLLLLTSGMLFVSAYASAQATAGLQPGATLTTPRVPSPTPRVASPTPRVPSPTPRVPSQPVRLVIPAIELDRPLVSVGLDRNRVPIVPKHDAAWYNLSAKPGGGENIVLWGHVLRFRAQPNIPAPFARVQELQPGDRMTIFTADGRSHAYVVHEQIWVRPEQVEYILPQGRELVTMVSCIGDKVIVGNELEMSHRLITIALPVR
jgi:sortase (surface protein transpeptidase)